MVTPLTTIDASEPLDKILDIIARDGGIIVSNVLSPELLNECMTAIEPHMSGRKLYDSKATHEELGDAFFPEGSQRVYVRLCRHNIKHVRVPLTVVCAGSLGSHAGATCQDHAMSGVAGHHGSVPEVSRCHPHSETRD